MEKKILLGILGFGILSAMLSGLLLYLPATFIKNNIRYIMPLPPIAVAVYVYVLRIVEVKFANSTALILELMKMSAIAGITFLGLAGLLLLFLKTTA